MGKIEIEKQKEIKLETVLAAIIDINYADNYKDLFELTKFVFMDPIINDLTFKVLRPSLRVHILELHPELEGINYEPTVDGDINIWLAIKKMEFGDTLPICVIGRTLTKKGKEKVKSADEYFKD